MHKRNTNGIKSAAQKKRAEALERTEKALAALIKEQTAINFNTVARAASVSTSWLYGERELCDRIKFLRNQGKSKRQPPKTRASDSSKDAIIRTLKDKNRQLREEVKALKLELERAYGKALSADKQSKHLKSVANQLRKRLATSEATQVSESKVPVVAKEPISQTKISAEAKVEALGIPLNQSLRKLIKRSELSIVENAIQAFQAQQSPILNPGGWFRKALLENWEATEPVTHSEESSSQSKVSAEFAVWYSKVVKGGFLVDEPINLLPIVSGETQVKIRRPDPFGAPYTLSPWQAAKLEWDAIQGISG
ncbi:MAG: DUF6262 family protein [Cyanobacteria bacterium P01_F01_bin.53]